jgi:hypothetical protein
MTIKADSFKVRGKLGFNDFLTPFAYQGKGTPKFGFTLTNLSPQAVARIEERFGSKTGMNTDRIKFDEEYADNGQTTKFSSAFAIPVKLDGVAIVSQGKDAAGNNTAVVLDPIASKIGRGSDVIVKVFADKNDNPRVSYIDIVDLVTFDGDDAEEDDSDMDVL